MTLSPRLRSDIRGLIAPPLLTALLFTLCGCGAGLRSAPATGVPASLLSVSSAPSLGYAWSTADRTLRPINGISGAAQFGQSVVPAATYDFAAADPSGRFAILLGENQSVYSMALPSGAPVLLSVKAANNSKIVFAPQGAFALIFGPGASSATVVANLSGTPQFRSTGFSGALINAAVNDSGGVAAAFTSAEGVAIQVSPSNGQTVAVAAALKGFGGLAFVAGTDDLLLGDSVSNRLLRVQNASTSAAITTLPTAGLLKSPVSIGTSRTARWAVVANGADPSAVRVDLIGNTTAQRSACGCQPSMVAQLSADGAFRLTALQDGPVWIADASRSAFPVQFVPGVPKTGTAAEK